MGEGKERGKKTDILSSQDIEEKFEKGET